MNNWSFKYHSIVFLIIVNFFFIWNPYNTYAQNVVIEDIIEELASRSGNEETDYSTFVEDLNYYLTNPLNLNDADIEKLERLHFLTEFQIENLLNYVAVKGGMTTIYELQLIEGFDANVIKKMLPFVTVAKVARNEKLNIVQVLNYGSHKLIGETNFILQNQQGYIPDLDTVEKGSTTSKYLGDKIKYKLRYRFHYKDKVFAGVTAEKDPGEAFTFEQKRYGFDFYSFHFQVNNVGVIKNLAIGDFQVKFGQGLILWRGFGMGKSSDVLNIRKKGQGIRYYTSTDENNFMRGIGSTIKLGKFGLTAFYSWKKVDANLEPGDTLNVQEEKISSLQNSGYHRTLSELIDRKVVDEKVMGTKLALSITNLKLSANFVGYEYDVDLEKSDKPYKLFDFEGNKNFNASIDYHLFYKKLSFFGEVAIGRNGAIAVQNGFIAAVVPQLSFSLLHRYYQKDYQAYYSNSFSENTKINNEQGLFYGLEFHPVRKLKISTYVDSYQFPWLKFGVDAPSNGNEYFVQASYIINRNVDMYFRWRNESKASNYILENKAFKLVEHQKKVQYRYHISYRVSDLIGLRNRIEITDYQHSNLVEYGYMFYQDVNFDLKKLPLSFYIRYAVFDTPYDARIYAYENDILYSFSVPAYSGKGSRFYVMLKYAVAKMLDLRLRYSHFFYPEQETIGSGLSEIQGNLKSELKFQFSLRF